MWLPVDVAPSVVVASFLSLLFNVALWSMSLVSTQRAARNSQLAPVRAGDASCCVRRAPPSQHGARPGQVGGGSAPLQHSQRCLRRGERPRRCGGQRGLSHARPEASASSTVRMRRHCKSLTSWCRAPYQEPSTIPSGSGGLRYEWIMAISCSSLFWSFDIVAAQVFAGASVQAVVATALGRSTYACAALPLALALVFLLSGRCTHLSGWRRIVFVLFLTGVWILWLSLWSSVLELAVSVAREDLLAFILLSLVSAACFLLTYFVLTAGHQDSNASAAWGPTRRRWKNWPRHSDRTGSRVTHRTWREEESSGPAYRCVGWLGCEERFQQSCARHPNDDREGHHGLFSALTTDVTGVLQAKRVAIRLYEALSEVRWSE